MPDSQRKSLPAWLKHDVGQSSSDSVALASVFSSPGQPFTPPTDVVDYADRIAIRMEVAGVDRDELLIVHEDRFLVVQGRRKRPPHELEARTYRLTEIQYGPFGRVFEFPDSLDLNHIRAEYHEGFLTVVVPKSDRATAQPTSLRIKIKDTP